MMLSVRRSLQNLIKTAITRAFPIQEDVTIKEVTDRGEIYDYDYSCEAPKDIFDKHKIHYKMRNTFYGLSTYKEVGEDLKAQIPRNDLIAKVQALQNGSLKIRIRNDYIQNHINNYEALIAKQEQNQVLVCLPALVLDKDIGYDYFRAINKAESVIRICKAFNFQTNLVFPYLSGDEENSSVKRYNNIFHNYFFNIDPVYLSLLNMTQNSAIIEILEECIKSGDVARIKAYYFTLLWKTLIEDNKFLIYLTFWTKKGIS